MADNQTHIKKYYSKYIERPKNLGFVMPSFEHSKWLRDLRNTWNHRHEGLRIQEEREYDNLKRRAAKFQDLVGKQVQHDFGKQHGLYIGTIEGVVVGNPPKKTNELAVLVRVSYLDISDPVDFVELDEVLTGRYGELIISAGGGRGTGEQII